MKQIIITLNEDNKTNIVIGENTSTREYMRMEIDGDNDMQLEKIFSIIGILLS